MAKGKRATLSVSIQKEWLDLQQEGMTPPKIAAKAGYDVRTVRRYLKLQNDQNQREKATLAVYQDALQAHFRDLAQAAEGLDMLVKSDKEILIPVENPILSSLREHMRHTSLWSSIKRWNDQLVKMAATTNRLEDKIKSEIDSDSRLRDKFPPDNLAVLESLPQLLIYQSRKLARGERPLNIQENFKITGSKREGIIEPHYGPYRFGPMTLNAAEFLGSVITEVEGRIIQWNEFADLKALIKAKQKLSKELREKLAYIIYRRVVSGKCKYCPW